MDYFEHSPTIRDAVGQLLVQSGRFKEAVAMFRQASVLSEDDASLRERLALALYYAGDSRESGEILNKLTQSEPFSKRADLFLVLGECHLRNGRTRDARYAFEAATQLDPDSAHGWQGLGRTALEGGDLRRADLALQKAASLDPAAGETQLLAGYLRLRQERWADALVAFRKACAADAADSVSLCMIGYAYEKMGQADKAMRYYTRALRIKPGDDLASQLLAGVDPGAAE